MNCRGMQEPRHGPTAQPGRPMSLCVRVCFARSYLFGRAWWHVKPVSLILGTALMLAGLHHHEGDAAAIWPVTAHTKKNSSQFGHGKILHRVRKVNDHGQIL